MFRHLSVIYQTLTGTLYTWALTALGAALVVFIRGNQYKMLDISLGFAAGVMTAASFWSLLEPAIENVKENSLFNLSDKLAFLPASIGFLLGALFVYFTDHLISKYGIESSHNAILKIHSKQNEAEITDENELDSCKNDFETNDENIQFESRDKDIVNEKTSLQTSLISDTQWKRMLLLIIAITVHNIPEGMAVGVAFAAVGSSAKSTFERARNLAIGIGIQNFPEGLAVSLPLHAAGFSVGKSFWYGQLSGMVEPIFGIVGAMAVTYTKLLLPFALAFAAGAMIYVVIDDIIPEANSRNNNKLASWSAIFGFILMMCLDVGLGDEIIENSL